MKRKRRVVRWIVYLFGMIVAGILLVITAERLGVFHFNFSREESLKQEATDDEEAENREETKVPVLPSPEPSRQLLLPEESLPQKNDTLHLLAVGDNIIHKRVGDSGRNDTDVWSYDHLYQYVREDIEAADLSIVVQETIFVENHENFSGYPSFGTPTEVGDALVNAGFDIVTQATNHSLDRGIDAVRYTAGWWKEKYPQTAVLGIHESPEAADEITVVESQSFKIALLNYTETINPQHAVRGHDYLVDIYHEASAREDIRRAKEMADVVLVVMHVGMEYVTEVDSSTKAMTKVFLEEGVDIVIGSHPHVIRPMETLVRGDGHEMLVYYSLGNFISCQDRLPCLLGGMADIVLKRDEISGKIVIESAQMIPLVTHYNHDTQTYAVYKLEDYTEELANNHSAYYKNPDTFSINYYKNLFGNIIKCNYSALRNRIEI